jgi:hypothetical protein
VIAFQLIAGRRPFDSDESLLLMVAKKTKRAPTLREVSGVDHAPLVESVMASVLATAPKDRYPTASGFVEDLIRASLGKDPYGVARSGLPVEDSDGPPDYVDPAEIVSDLLAVATHAQMTGTTAGGKAHRGPIATPIALARMPSQAFRTDPPAAPAAQGIDREAPTDPPPAPTPAPTDPAALGAALVSDPPAPIGPRDTQPMSALELGDLRPTPPPADLAEMVMAPVSDPEPTGRADDTVPLRPASRGRAALALDVNAFEQAVEQQRAAQTAARRRPAAEATQSVRRSRGAGPSPGMRVALLVAGTLLAILVVALVIRLVVRPLLAPQQAQAPAAVTAPVGSPPP